MKAFIKGRADQAAHRGQAREDGGGGARVTAKKRVTISVDAEVHRAAKELGLNISATCEQCLRDAVEKLREAGA